MIRSLTLLFGLFLTIGLVTAPSVAQAAGKVKVKVQVEVEDIAPTAKWGKILWQDLGR